MMMTMMMTMTMITMVRRLGGGVAAKKVSLGEGGVVWQLGSASRRPYADIRFQTHSDKSPPSCATHSPANSCDATQNLVKRAVYLVSETSRWG